MTFAVLEVLSLQRAPGGGLARARAKRGLAFAALGGATLRLLKERLEKHLRRRNRQVRRWGRSTAPEPIETALAMAMLGALALPLMLEQEPRAPAGREPAPPSGKEAASARSVDDDGEDGDDLGLNGAIASW